MDTSMVEFLRPVMTEMPSQETGVAPLVALSMATPAKQVALHIVVSVVMALSEVLSSATIVTLMMEMVVVPRVPLNEPS